MNFMRFIFDFILDLIFPKTCVDCGQEGHYFCLDKFASEPLVEYFSSKKGWYLNGIIAGASYQNKVVQDAIKLMKYRSISEIAGSLGALLGKQVERFLGGDGIFVPVPLARSRQLERGFNQAQLIAYSLAADNRRFVNALVRLARKTPQVELARPERRANVRGVFGPTGDVAKVKDKTVFVVDDVATTGATLNECAKVLKKAGAKKVFGLVVARD